MVVQHNIPAMNSNRQLGINNSAVSKNLEKLSSGFKINRAGDDAAGLAISEKMRAQIKGLDRAAANAQDGISLIQTAEGALTEVHSMLNRMVELATQSANGTYSDAVDREALQEETNALRDEIDRISQATNFNGINLLDGSLGGGKSGALDGVNFTSGSIAKFKPAEFSGITFGSANISGTFGGTLTAGKDTFVIDGEKLTIDWSKGDAKVLFDDLKSTATMTDAKAKDVAAKLTDLFNKAAAEQGLKGSVKVDVDAGRLVFKSTSKNFDSEFSFEGSNTTSDSMGGVLFGAATGSTNKAISNVADKLYNGENINQSSTFNMNINGKDVLITFGATATKGETTMDDMATALQTAVQSAIDEYNKVINSATNPDNALLASDFTVEANKEGSLVIKYTGDNEKVNFSFSDIQGLSKDTDAASKLGLAAGSSSSGGNRGLELQVGDTSQAFNKVSVSVDDMSARGLGLGNIDVSTKEAASKAQDDIKAAINQVSANRGRLGALQNRLEHTINNLGVTSENMSAAESRVRDTDMAKQMMDFTKSNVLTQAAQAMLAQANQQPQGVLQLLR